MGEKHRRGVLAMVMISKHHSLVEKLRYWSRGADRKYSKKACISVKQVVADSMVSVSGEAGVGGKILLGGLFKSLRRSFKGKKAI